MTQDQQILGMLDDIGCRRDQSPEISSTNAASAAQARRVERQAVRWPRTLLACGLLGVLALSQTACGQKGPLYLPAPSASTPNSSTTAK